jgi:hypothetical protein
MGQHVHRTHHKRPNKRAHPNSNLDSAAVIPGSPKPLKTALLEEDDESEIAAEELAEFASAIKSMKTTLKNLRAPMAQKRVDPLLAAHPNHRLTFHELHTQDRAHSVFVSLTSYYSKHCKATVRSLFDSATDDQSRLRIFVGAVQVSTPPPPHTTTFEPLKGVPAPPLAMEPLPEHTGDSCLGDPVLTDCPEKFFCAADNVKIRELKKEEWRGHGYARYLSVAMYRAEAFVMFMDARASVISHNWHSTLEHEWLAVSLAAASQRVVLSHRVSVYVEKEGAKDHGSGDAHHHAANLTVPEGPVAERIPLCSVVAPADGVSSALPGTLEAGSTKYNAGAFLSTPFASASFLYGPGTLLLEKIFEARSWTSECARDWHLSASLHYTGFDVYAPKSIVVAVEQKIADEKKTAADTVAEAAAPKSEVEEGDKYAAAVLDGREALPVHPANSRKSFRKMAAFESLVKQAKESSSACKELQA